MEDKKQPRAEETAGQGIVEYALILVLVAVVVILSLSVLGPTISNVYKQIVSALKGNKTQVCTGFGGSVEVDPLCLNSDGSGSLASNVGNPSERHYEVQFYTTSPGSCPGGNDPVPLGSYFSASDAQSIGVSTPPRWMCYH